MAVSLETEDRMTALVANLPIKRTITGEIKFKKMIRMIKAKRYQKVINFKNLQKILRFIHLNCKIVIMPA